jgi:hypothetical protein
MHSTHLMCQNTHIEGSYRDKIPGSYRNILDLFNYFKSSSSQKQVFVRTSAGETRKSKSSRAKISNPKVKPNEPMNLPYARARPPFEKFIFTPMGSLPLAHAIVHMYGQFVRGDSAPTRWWVQSALFEVVF